MCNKKVLTIVFSVLNFSLLCLPRLGLAAGTQINIEHWTTANGAQVYFVARKQVPIVDVAVAFDAGSARDGANYGLANLTGMLLDDGAPNLNADQIADQFDSLGAMFDVQTTQDMTVVSLRSLSKPDILSSAVQLFTSVLDQATMPADAFSREQKIAIANIQAAQQDPTQVASIAFFKAVYGNNPYGTPIYGTIDSINNITRADVVAFYQQYYVAQNATVSLVGDLDSAQAHAIANEVVAKLATGTAPAAIPTPVATGGQTIHINYPATQTTVYLGQLGIKRGDPDYFPLMIANYSLGGGMVSRLFNEVREKNGYTYGVDSYFYPLKNNGPFLISLQTQVKNTDAAIALTKKITNNYIQSGPTPAELTAAKQNFVGGFPLRIDQNSDLETYLIIIGFYHLPLNYLNNFVSDINNVTLNQVQQALKTRLNPNDFVTVTVGP